MPYLIKITHDDNDICYITSKTLIPQNFRKILEPHKNNIKEIIIQKQNKSKGRLLEEANKEIDNLPSFEINKDYDIYFKQLEEVRKLYRRKTRK